ncbi:MAG: hypothetical protein K0R92_103 [Lachnospiraceae bacterium]|jgi:hypothetical protein|nr:hypothetical protein [Lachnospiraceae bacterium]
MEQKKEELFIETQKGNVPVESDIIEKYDLKEGTFTPFTHERIVDKNGEFIYDMPEQEPASLNQGDDEIDEMENGLALSTSEMIDIAQGVDSQ